MSFEDAVQNYIKSLEARGVPPEFLKLKQKACRYITAAFGGSSGLADIAPSDYSRVLEGLKGPMRQQVASVLNATTRLARHKGAQVIVPGETIETRDHEASDPGIAHHDAIDCFLSALKYRHPEYWGQAYLIIGLGVRTTETSDAYQTENSIVIPAGGSKTNSRRVIDIPEFMGPMIEDPCPGWGELRSTHVLRWLRLRREVGIPGEKSLFRHTVASHWINIYADTAKAALMLGHHQAVLHAHYKALVPQSDTDAWVEVIRKHFG